MKNIALIGLVLVALVSCQVKPVATKSPSMDDFKYPYKTHKITLDNGLEVAYVDEGKGAQTLVFIHGLGSYLPAWQKNIDVLRKDYRCIALDLPNYGKSSKGDYAFTMRFFAETVWALVDELKLENVVLVGHSMGGQVATWMMLERPDGAEKLVLIAPAGFETFTAQEKAWFGAVYTPAVVRATTEEQIKKNFHLNFVEMPEDAQFMIKDRLYMRQNEAEYTTYCNMIPKCVQGMLNEPTADRLHEIAVPTLVLYGAQDALIPNKYLHPTLTVEAVAQSGADKIPNSSLHLVDNCGHFVQWECADAVNAHLKAFL